MVSWSVPPIWKGKTIAILASGPSMSREVADAVRDAGIPAIVINNTFRLAPWATMLYAADVEWWASNPAAKDFEGMKVSCQMVRGVQYIKHTGVMGFDPDVSAIRTGGNSGYQALHIAAHARAARVLLCGFDMHGLHWHPEHEAPLKSTIQETYPRWVHRFALMATVIQREVDVVNVTPDSALTCFRRSTLEKELALCAESAAP